MVRAAVFDLDGVVFDVSERLRRCFEEAGCPDCRSSAELPREARRRFWQCFLSPRYMHLDRVNEEVVEHMRRLRAEGVRIIIVTGRRRDTQGDATIEQLRRHGVPFDEIYFREPGDYRRDAEYKADVLRQLLEKGYEIVEVWDDSEAVVEAAKRVVPGARVVLYRVGVGVTG